MTTASPVPRSVPTLRRRATGLAAAAALSGTVAVVGPSPIPAAAVEPGPVVSSEFGDVQVDGSDNCSPGDVEVATVVNRIIVQTEQPPADVAVMIDAWRAVVDSQSGASKARAVGPSGGAETSTDPMSTRVVDSIRFAPFGVEGISPVYAFELPGAEPYNVIDLARWLAGHGLDAAPDYVTTLNGPTDFFEPDGLPAPSDTEPTARPPLEGEDAAPGSGVRMMVFDSGLVDLNHASDNALSLLSGVSALRAIDIENPDRNGDGTADTGWVGHGLAISSEIGGLVPGSTVENVRVTRGGLSTEFTAAKAIASTLNHVPAPNWPHLLVASFGTSACDLDPTNPGDGELVPVALEAASALVDRLSDRPHVDMVIVAAAGNHGTTRREYPAAFTDVIAVGAIDASRDGDANPLTSASRTGPVADFSGRGEWVDVYAPGQDIVTLHVEDLLFRSGSETVEINGSAVVQGTSFAAPYVASQLAELMATHNIAVSDAFDRLVDSGVPPQEPCSGPADLGHASAVALVDLGGASDAAPVTEPADVCERGRGTVSG